MQLWLIAQVRVSITNPKHTKSNSMSDENKEWITYHYTPTRLGAGIAAALFCTGLLCLTLEVYYFGQKTVRRNKFVQENPFEPEKQNSVVEDAVPGNRRENTIKYIPLLVGCQLEAMGYVARAVSSSDVEATMPYAIQSVLLLVAPSLSAATIYMLFGKMLVLLRCTNLSIIPSRYNTKFFVAGDILSFFVQSGGGALMSKGKSITTGTNVVIAGLFIQIVFFGFFLLTELKFAFKVNSVVFSSGRTTNTWKTLNYTLLFTSLLILIRSVVRVVEFIQGFDGYIAKHEIYIYVFDAVPMFLVLLAFIVTMPFGSIFKLEAQCP